MNQQTRELWQQCVVKHTKTPMNWQHVADMFAELLIKECISEIYMVDVGDLKGRSYCLDKVAEHLEKWNRRA